MKTENYDVIVAGAGLAGVCAATAAARAGARTLAVEKEPFAGGIATAGLETSICNYFHNTRHERIVRGCALELIERMVRRGAVSGNWERHRGHVVFDVELGKLCMDEMLADAGAHVLYDTLIVDALTRDGTVEGLRLANRSGISEVQARCFVDATGDADVAAQAGEPLRIDRNEHSFLFRLGNVDVDELVRYLKDNPSEYATGIDIDLSFEEAMAFYEDTGILFFHHGCGRRMTLIRDAVASGEYPTIWGPYRAMEVFQMHAMRVNRTMIVNTGFFELPEPDGRALSDFLQQGRKMARYVADFLAKTLPGLKNSFVLATANASGLRRTRFLNGEFKLTRDVYDQAPLFDDRIGRGVLVEKGRQHLTDRTFDIPLRCLLPTRVGGLIIGSGRSASSECAELLRIMPVTMVIGQGAGVVAAQAAAQSSAPRDVDIQSVQRELQRQGVSIGN